MRTGIVDNLPPRETERRGVYSKTNKHTTKTKKGTAINRDRDRDLIRNGKWVSTVMIFNCFRRASVTVSLCHCDSNKRTNKWGAVEPELCVFWFFCFPVSPPHFRFLSSPPCLTLKKEIISFPNLCVHSLPFIAVSVVYTTPYGL